MTEQLTGLKVKLCQNFSKNDDKNVKPPNIRDL